VNPALLAGCDRSIWRPHQRGTLARGVLNCIIGLLELAANAAIRHLAEIGMRPTMIANFVTFPRGSRNNLGVFRDVLANHEEGCLDVARSQQIE
jgi:hypothetical protein